ncbi:MAG: glucose-1-phosphate cytidylyltransferase [Alphaproteobacteria bacterium]|nr:glucose-1-phosphate cytidylyltransferase [Alphaproteobacteria bacterium]
MKVVILAGGLGTRLSEETDLKPKPMVEIGGKPILWHIMKIYNHYGFNDFVICLGYKGYLIKEYFYHYYLHNSDITIDIKNNATEIHNYHSEAFKVTLIDTGQDTKTAGRIQKIKPFLNNEDFMLTYGDGLCNVNINELVQFHKNHNKLVTLTAIKNSQRFGTLEINDNFDITSFKEKTKDSGVNWINGGFFVVKYDIFNFLDQDLTQVMWEDEPLENITKAGQLVAYQHTGFWKCMDALRDKIELEALWKHNKAAWKIW